MKLDLAACAADIARNLGCEFPDPLTRHQDMVLRQLSSLAEEAIELDEALGTPSSTTEHIGEEMAQTVLCAYLVAHYAEIPLDRSIDFTSCYQVVPLVPPHWAAGQAMKAGRRWLGIARRHGTKEALASELAKTVIAVDRAARHTGINLDVAMRNALDVIFSRGWKEPSDVSH